MELKYPEDYIIKTARLVLRPPQSEDVDGLWPYVSDARITTFLAWEPHTDKIMTAGLIQGLQEAQRNGKGYHWVITFDGKIIGLTSLIDVRRTHRVWTFDRAELSYWLGIEHQGHGYATEAGHAVLQFGFEQLGLHKIIVAHAADNQPSGKVAQRLGFKPYATERDAFKKAGQWHDLIWYDLLEREFTDLNKLS